MLLQAGQDRGFTAAVITAGSPAPAEEGAAGVAALGSCPRLSPLPPEEAGVGAAVDTGRSCLRGALRASVEAVTHGHQTTYAPTHAHAHRMG